MSFSIKPLFRPIKIFMLEFFTKYWIRKYLNDQKIGKKKLQFGCGGLTRPGWLNSDLANREYFARRLLFIDATQNFPIPDNSFDFLYAEHMIEHLKIEEGRFFVKECYRILKPSGVLRLAFPALEFILDFYHTQAAWGEKFFQFWANPKNALNYGVSSLRLPISTRAGVVNLFFSEWGHKNLYDFIQIQDLLNSVGFMRVLKRPNGESDFLELRELETRTFSLDSVETATPYAVEAVK